MNLNWKITWIELKNTGSCLFTAVKLDFSNSWPLVMWNTYVLYFYCWLFFFVLFCLFFVFLFFQCHLVRKSFQNDEEWRLFCCIIQSFYLCILDSLGRHNRNTKWYKITKYGISVQILNLLDWNFAELMYCNNDTFLQWLWFHHSDILVTGPLPSKTKTTLFVAPEFNRLSCACAV